MVKYSWDIYADFKALWPKMPCVSCSREMRVSKRHLKPQEQHGWMTPADVETAYGGRIRLSSTEVGLWSNRSAVIHASKALEKLEEKILRPVKKYQ